MDIPELDIEDDDTRREALRAKYGQPEHFDRFAALRLIGRRDEVHPDDALAFLYASREAAEAFAATNERYSSIRPLGIMEHDGAWLGVLDLRGTLGRSPITDPAVADDGGHTWRAASWRPPRLAAN